MTLIDPTDAPQEPDDVLIRFAQALSPYKGPLMMTETVEREPTNIEGVARLRAIIAELQAMDAPTDDLVELADEWEGLPYERTYSPLLRMATERSSVNPGQKVHYWGQRTLRET